MRAGLSMLGISWGIVSVVMLLAYGNGFDAALLRGFEGAFGDGVSIVAGGQTSMQAGGERAGQRIRLRFADAEVVGQVPYVKQWSPEFTQMTPIAWRDKQSTYLSRGVAPSYASMRSERAAAGRFIDTEDVRLQRRVAFLGSEVARKMFGNTPPVGQSVRIKGVRFDVIGVQHEKIQLSNYNSPDKESIFIPYTTAGQLWNTEYLNYMVFQSITPTLNAKTTSDIRNLLAGRLRFNPKDQRALFFWGFADTQKIVGPIVFGLKVVLTFIGVLTLAIGGVGVMNIMFVSVTERTREIGLRKAIGATRRRILADFLVEGTVLALVSGALGWLGAWSLATLVNSFPMPEMFAGLPVRGATTAFAFSALGVIAILSALIPAWRAASLTPVEALRYER